MGSEGWGGTGGGWGNPVVGSTALRIPAINSPNFNLANPSASPSPSWAILQNGLAYFFGLVLSGGTITGPDYVINTSGIFIYSGTPANGNLIGSWAGAAGTDAFGNTYPQGFNISMGSISGTVFNGTDFILNTNGLFIYSGTPALGNLIASVAPAPGTDSFGNVYLAGIYSYNSNGARLGMAPTGGQAQLHLFPAGATQSTEDALIYSGVFNPGAINESQFLTMTSGKSNGERDSGVQFLSEPADASASENVLFALGGQDVLFMDRNNVQTFAATPIVVFGETWHNMILLNGWTVGSGGFAQYKLMPDNTVMIRLNNVTPGTITDGTSIWTAPSGYVPSTHHKLDLIAAYSAAPAYGSMPFLYTNGSALEVFNLRGTVSGIQATASYALD